MTVCLLLIAVPPFNVELGKNDGVVRELAGEAIVAGIVPSEVEAWAVSTLVFGESGEIM